MIPVGQAYDGGPEGGRPGPPPPDEIRRFLAAAERYGATGASFWSWQHATPEIWAAIGAAGEVALPPLGTPLSGPDVLAVQAQLGSLGYAVPVTGTWDQPTIDALPDAPDGPRRHADGPARRPRPSRVCSDRWPRRSVSADGNVKLPRPSRSD